MTVGFIGLGGMGKAIALNLLRAGHEMVVWNRSPGAADPLAAEGAAAADAAAGAGKADIVSLMLADGSAARTVLVAGGVLDALHKGGILVNLATVPVGLARGLAAECNDRGLGYVAAPVLGRPDVAAAGKLQVPAAAAPDHLARVQPLLDIIGQKTWQFGPAPERANAAKLAANFMIAAVIKAMGEAAALAEGYEAKGPPPRARSCRAVRDTYAAC